MLALLPVLVLAACASHGPAQPGGGSQPGGGAQPRTVIKTFHAYRADGGLTVQVADIAVGHCWTTSIAVPDTAGAYRCLSANQILDPCFAPAKPSKPLEVACIADPWSQAQVLRLTGKLPKRGPGGGGARPWALVLDNGARCVAATGMVPEIRGVNLDYHCRNGRDAGALNTNRALGTAAYADQRGQTLKRVPITTIWRG